MLIQRIQYSMNRVLEGLDRCEPHVILEASQEFTNATEELKKNIAAFVDICKPFDQLAGFITTLDISLQNLNAIKLDDISDEYSFTDHYKMQNAEIKDEGEANPEFMVSTIALEYPTYVNALRDGILEVAKWLEEHKAVFSVGKNGIFLTDMMQSFVGDGVEIKVNTFCDTDGLEILKKVSGITEIDELKKHYEKAWKTDDLQPDKFDNAWEEFTGNFDKIGQGAQAAHDAATNIIKGSKPPDEVKKAGESSGGILKSVLGSIFGGKSDSEKIMPPIPQEPEWIIGSSKDDNERGIFAMSFEELQQLVTKIIEFASTANEAGAKALNNVDDHQSETMKPTDNQTKLIELLKDSEYKFDQEQIATIGKALEAAGMKDGDWKSVDKAKAKEELLKVFKESEGNSDKTNAVMKLLYGGQDDESGEPIDIDELKNELEGLEIDDEFSDGLASLLDSLVDDDGNPKEELDASDVEAKIDEIEPDGESLPDDFKNDLINFLSDEQIEESVYRRWNKLAGILKS